MALAALTAVGACAQRDLRPLNPCTIAGVSIKVAITSVDEIDMLFVVDNSGSMADEQAALSREIPRLVQVLASGMADDGTTFPPVRDLRVGVVSTDMGTGGNTIGTCNEPNFGDDGVLRRGTSGGSCSPIPTGQPPYLGFRPATDGDPAAFGQQVQCVANLGITGCGFEQQLDAMLKAVTPATSSVEFVNGSRGHGTTMNEGFLRENSLLAVIMLTDEDDCSASNPDIFNRMSPTFTDPDLNLRCWRYGDPSFGAVHPVQRYVDGLLALRDPELLVFAAITGIPPELAPGPGASPNYELLVGDESVRNPAMIEMPDPTMPSQLRPACNVPGSGVAYPAVRITKVAQALEQARASAVVQSICNDNYSGALDAIIRKIADVLSATCLPRALNQDADGRVTCDIVEALPLTGEVTSCTQLADRGRVFRERDEEGREVCTVCQTDASGNVIDTNPECQALGVNAGWFYESGDSLDGCPDSRRQRISFTTGAEPRSGSQIRLECLQQSSSGEGDVTIGTGCAMDENSCADRGVIFGQRQEGMICDVLARTCELPCNNTSDCAAAGLGGYACHDPDGDDGPRVAICVNPTCTN